MARLCPPLSSGHADDHRTRDRRLATGGSTAMAERPLYSQRRPRRAAAGRASDAAAARRLGGKVLTNCAVRGLDIAAGRVAGVVTEKGRVACESAVLAGGAWSRLFCRNLGITLP